jgi:hypothetical protein
MAVGANKFGMGSLAQAGIISVFAGVIVFGLDMVVRRRAEIGTRGSGTMNPSFHVFRGVGAVAWGVVFVTMGAVFAGYAYISLTDWTSAKELFGAHPGILVSLAGIVIMALGVGSATRATYRHRDLERGSRRLADRLTAIALTLPIGLAILAWGLLQTFAPSLAKTLTSTAQAAALKWLESFLK